MGLGTTPSAAVQSWRRNRWKPSDVNNVIDATLIVVVKQNGVCTSSCANRVLINDDDTAAARPANTRIHTTIANHAHVIINMHVIAIMMVC